MRKLNAKQKKLITKYYEENKLNRDSKDYYGNVVKLKQECEEINDYETLYTDINRLLYDLLFTDDYKETIKNS